MKLLVSVLSAIVLFSNSTQAGLATANLLFNDELNVYDWQIQLEGAIEQGITSVTYDGVSLFDDPTAERLGMDSPFDIGLEEVRFLDSTLLKVKDGANEIPAAVCCILIDHEPKSRLLIGGEPVVPSFSDGSFRQASVGQQLSIQSEPSFDVSSFYHTLYKIEDGVNRYVHGVDTTVDATTIIDIAVFDAPGEYLLTSTADYALWDIHERILVVPEPDGRCILMGLWCISIGTRHWRRCYA